MNWYNSLNKPFLNPPSELFMPVWIILYIMIFASLVIFLKGGINRAKVLPLILFAIQMFLNFSWQGVFFGLKEMEIALIIVLFMWIFILLTIFAFYKHSKFASILLIPYFIWVTFAFYLNFEYVRLNPII